MTQVPPTPLSAGRLVAAAALLLAAQGVGCASAPASPSSSLASPPAPMATLALDAQDKPLPVVTPGPNPEEQEDEAGQEDVLSVPDRLFAPPLDYVQPLSPAEDFLAKVFKSEDGRYVVRGNDGSLVPLTLDGALHDYLKNELRSSRCPYCAAVAIEPRSGRVLAIVDHSEARPHFRGLATRAIFPAASVFKVITASALLHEGLTGKDSVCIHGGEHVISREQLLDSSLDKACFALDLALGKSVNAVFAKLTFKYLSAQKLRRAAEAFRFNRPIPFPMPIEVSKASFSGGSVKVAATGAGFGNVFLSPFHGAAIASAIANGGVWKNPLLFDKESARPDEGSKVMSLAEARALAEMLSDTVTVGTASRVFGKDAKSFRAAGKTGTLSDVKGRLYSWFIGYAPKENAQIAVGLVTVSEGRRMAPAAFYGHRAMGFYLGAQGLVRSELP